MQSCQSRRIRAHLINTAIQTLNTRCILLDTSRIVVDRRFYITDLSDTQGLGRNGAHVLHIISMCIIGTIFVIGRQNLGGPTIRIVFALNGEGTVIPLQEGRSRFPILCFDIHTGSIPCCFCHHLFRLFGCQRVASVIR